MKYLFLYPLPQMYTSAIIYNLSNHIQSYSLMYIMIYMDRPVSICIITYLICNFISLLLFQWIKNVVSCVVLPTQTNADSIVSDSNAIVVISADVHSSQDRRTILLPLSLRNCTMHTVSMVLLQNS